MKHKYSRLTPDQKYDLLTKDFLERDGDTFVRIRRSDRIGWEDTLPEDTAYSAAILSPKDERDLYAKAMTLARQMITSMNHPYRVNVRVDPKRSCTDSHDVYVATKVFDDPDLSLGQKLDTFLGLTVHEGSHLLYTDFNQMKSIRTKLVHTLQNIFEDERIERELGEQKPGLANFLKATKYYYFGKYKEKEEEVPQDKPVRLVNAILCMVRYPAGLIPDEVREFADELLETRDILTPFPASTTECIRCAEKVAEIIKRFLGEEKLRKEIHSQKQQQEKQQQSPSEEEGQEQEENGQPSNDESGEQDESQEGTPSASGGKPSGDSSSENGSDDKSGDDDSQESDSRDGNSEEDEGQDTREQGSGNGTPDEDLPEDTDGSGEESDTDNNDNTDDKRDTEGNSGTGNKNDEDENDGEDADGNGSEDGDENESSSGNGEEENDDNNGDDENGEPGDEGSEDTDPGNDSPSSGEPDNDDDEDVSRAEPLSDAEAESILKEILEAAKELSSQPSGEGKNPLTRDDVSDTLNGNELLALECENELTIGHEAGTVLVPQRADKTRYDASLQRVRRYIPAVAQALRAQGTEYKYKVSGTRSGMLDTNRLAEARQGVQNVYMRKGEVKCDRISIALLIDESGSMYGQRAQMARDTAVLVNEAVGTLRYVDLYIYGYTSGGVGDETANVLFPYRENHTGDRYALGSISDRGGTPTAQAVSEAAWRIRRNTQSPTILIVVSDGHADGGWREVRRATYEAKKRNIETVGVSVSSSLNEETLKLMYDRYIDMHDVKDLASELGRTIRDTILKTTKRHVG